jgi:hypothetical protein
MITRMITRWMFPIIILGILTLSAVSHAGCPGPHGAGSAPALSDDELNNVLLTAGFPQESLDTMRCIAQKESGAYPEAYCSSATDDEVLAIGVFQIHKFWFKECTGVDEEESQLNILMDPAQNAKCARRVYLSSRALTNNPYKQWDVYRIDGACHGLDARYP